MNIRRSFVLILVLIMMLVPMSAQARSSDASVSNDVNCILPDSNAKRLEILSNYYRGYWWDHTDLTIAVQAHPKAKAAQLKAIHTAIATWRDTLLDCFNGQITLTNITKTTKNPQKADIVLHYVLRAGGVSFEGYAICGDHRCPNILVSSDLLAVVASFFLSYFLRLHAPLLDPLALEPEQVAESVVAGLDAESFLILPHPEVAQFFQNKANDYERWIGGMRKLQRTVFPE